MQKKNQIKNDDENFSAKAERKSLSLKQSKKRRKNNDQHVTITKTYEYLLNCRFSHQFILSLIK